MNSHKLAYAGTVCVLWLAFGHQIGRPQTDHYASSGVVVPIEITKDVAFFQIHVTGRPDPLWLSLDSGSASNYIDANTAVQFGFHPTGSGVVHGAGSGEVPVQFIDSVTIELPGLQVKNCKFKSTDLSSVSEQFGRAENGFLGYDFLSHYVVAVDYAGGKMTIYEPPSFQYRGHGETLPVTFRHNWPYVHGVIKVNGFAAQEREFLVDSGSGDAVDDPAIRQSSGPLRRIKTGVGLGTPTEGVLGRAEYVQLGRYRLEGPITSCCSANPDDLSKIGGEVLRRFTVIFDYPHQRIVLEPNGHFAEPFPNA